MKTRRRIHQLPRVDMTPFVSIALLLITFFICIKQLERPVILESPPPARIWSCAEPLHFSATIFLLANNRIGYLSFIPDKLSADYVETDYSKNGLRTQLLFTALKKYSVVLVKPTIQSTIKNLVDVINELTINGEIRYTLGYELTSAENQLIANYQQYKSANPQQPVLLRYPLTSGISNLNSP